MKNKKHTLHSAEEELVGTTHDTPAFLDEKFLLRDELRPVRLQLELLRPELTLRDHGVENTIVFFGSASIPPLEQAKATVAELELDYQQKPTPALSAALKQANCVLANSHYLAQAEQLAYLVSRDSSQNLHVLTGGGPSFMAAANQGAHRANAPSVSLNMMLPGELTPNEFITEKFTFQFHYFAIRKMHFLLRAKAMVAFPGGFGTLDELFETLTLIQTQKIEPIPILLFRKAFWQKVVNFEALVEEGTIKAKDLELIRYVETAEEAWAIIQDEI